MTYQPGDVYEQGAAIAIYWPDTHPCGPAPGRDSKPWIVLGDFGNVSFAAELQYHADGSHPIKLGNIMNGGARKARDN